MKLIIEVDCAPDALDDVNPFSLVGALENLRCELSREPDHPGEIDLFNERGDYVGSAHVEDERFKRRRA